MNDIIMYVFNSENSRWASSRTHIEKHFKMFTLSIIRETNIIYRKFTEINANELMDHKVVDTKYVLHFKKGHGNRMNKLLIDISLPC